MRRRLLPIVVVLASCAHAAPPAPAASAIPEGNDDTSVIPVGPLRRDLAAFADDSMRGRETGTPDADRAARFLVSRVRALGLEPAGDSLYLQRVPLQVERLGAASDIVMRDSDRTVHLRLGQDLVPLINLGEGVPPTRRSAAGDLAFVSYGLVQASPRRDDFAGLDLEGKVVVVVNGAPAGSDSATRSRLESETAISDRLAHILPQRPAAVIILMSGKGRAFYQQLAPSLMRTVTARSNAGELPDADRPLPMILLGEATAGSPLLPAGWPADDRARLMDGHRFGARIVQEHAPVDAFNVVAVVRGSDPTLRSTYVAFGAHYDHIGIVEPVAGDSIANGADDDGSGSMALLAIARATQAMPVKPKRSMLFVWHVGEEEGLLGSLWFVNHATVPIDSIVAQLNADMIGRNAPDLLYTVGPHVAPNHQSRRLGAVVDSVNALEPRPFTIDRTFDSAMSTEHLYERSDHFNYARKGIPIVFFTSGLHDDYHQPSDEVSKIDFSKLARVSRLLLDVGLAVANSPVRPL